MKKFFQTIWQTRAFRLWLMLVFCALLYRTIIRPIVGITEPIDLVMVPYLVIIPLLFLSLFDHIQWKHALAYGVPLSLLVYMAYACPNAYFGLLIWLIVVGHILWWVACSVSENRWGRIGCVASNLMVVIAVYIFQLGYNPIAFAWNNYEVYKEVKTEAAWDFLLVKKGDKYGGVDAISGKELLPICFDTITKRRGTGYVLTAKVNPKHLAPYKSSKTGASSGLITIHEDNLDILITPIVEQTFYKLKKARSSEPIHELSPAACDRLMDTEFTNLIWTQRATLFSDLFDLQRDSVPYDTSRLLDLTTHRLRQALDSLEVKMADTTTLGINSSDITDVRRTLTRCIMVSGMTKAQKEHYIYAHTLWANFISDQLPFAYNIGTNQNLNININDDLTQQMKFSITSTQLAKHDMRTWRDAFLMFWKSDAVFWKEQLEQTLSFGMSQNSNKGANAIQKLQMLIDNEQKVNNSLSDLTQQADKFIGSMKDGDTITRQENLTKGIQLICDILSAQQEAKNSLKDMRDGLVSIDFPDAVEYNSAVGWATPERQLDSLLFIETPQRLLSLLETKQYVELAAAVEEIISEILSAGFYRGYDMSEPIKRQLTNLTQKHRLVDYLEYRQKMIETHNKNVALMEQRRKDVINLIDQRIHRHF